MVSILRWFLSRSLARAQARHQTALGLLAQTRSGGRTVISSADSVLIEELRKKHAGDDTANFGVSDFLAAFGSPVDAVMYLRLFWPEFIRFKGMVFRQEALEDEDDRRRVREALRRYAGDKTRTERSFNLVEVPCGLFSRGAAESSDEVDRFLVEKLVELWKCRLAVKFPEQEFVVEAVPPEENAGERGVTFYTRLSQA